MLVQHTQFAEHALLVAGLAGVVGALVVSLLADTAIILLSSLIGAAAIVGAFPIREPIIALVGWVVLTAVGVGVQRRQQVVAGSGNR